MAKSSWGASLTRAEIEQVFEMLGLSSEAERERFKAFAEAPKTPERHRSYRYITELSHTTQSVNDAELE